MCATETTLKGGCGAVAFLIGALRRLLDEFEDHTVSRSVVGLADQSLEPESVKKDELDLW